MKKLKALQEINVAHNLLFGILSDEFINLPELKYVFLNNNNFQGDFTLIASQLSDEVVFDYKDMGEKKDIGLANTD